MNDRKSICISLLNRQGLSSAEELRRILNISQPTLSRTLAALPSSRVYRVGNARASRYGWRREVAGQTAWPLYYLDEHGEARHAVTLVPLAGKTWHIQPEENWPSMRHPLFPDGLYPDWPWFLDDIRPGGFLGRLFARMASEWIRVPPDPRDWTPDHLLLTASQYGSDLPGSWILGEEMLEMACNTVDLPCFDSLPDAILIERAESVLQGNWPGSSAAGEQPKFTLDHMRADGTRASLLVKFSGHLSDPVQSRWADILRAEHLANRILADSGISASKTSLRVAGNRLFLISERFDRTHEGGRHAWISLHALNAAFGDVNRNWTASAEDLKRQGWLSEQGSETLSVLWWFGRLIGNSDMHDGNLSLFFTPELPLRPTPVYDMCPMALAPRADGTLPGSIPPMPRPPPAQKQAFETALTLSQQFHEEILNDMSYSGSFRTAFLKRSQPR
jgi:hypothetical protein